MDVNEVNPAIFPINSLPNEMLAKIFKQLNYEDRNSAILVCKRWREICIWPALAADYPLSLKKYVEGWNPTDEIPTLAKRVFPYIEIDLFTWKKKLINKLPKNFYNKIKCIEVEVKNYSCEVDELQKFLDSCTALNKVIVGDIDDLLHRIEWPLTVQTIIVSQSSLFRKEKEVACLRSIKKQIPNIIFKEVQILLTEYNYFGDSVLSIDEKLKQILQSECGCLVAYNCHISKPITAQDVVVFKFSEPFYHTPVPVALQRRVFVYCENLNELEIRLRKLCTVIHGLTFKKSLTRIRFIATDWSGLTICFDCWESLLKANPELKELVSDHLVPISAKHLKIIPSHIRALEKLEVALDKNESHDSFFTYTLEKLSSLKYFSLRYGSSRNYLLNLKLISKLPYLPKLETLKLIWLNLNNSDGYENTVFSKFCLNVPSLKHLMLTVTGLTSVHAKAICENFPNLVTLEFIAHEEEEEKYDEEFYRIIIEHCKKLKQMRILFFRTESSKPTKPYEVPSTVQKVFADHKIKLYIYDYKPIWRERD